MHFDQFQIEEYLKKGIKLEIWYLQAVINRKYKIKEYKYNSSKIKIIKVKEFFHLKNLLKNNNSKCLYDVKINYNFNSRKIFQLLSKYKLKYLIHLRTPTNLYRKKINLKSFIYIQLKKIFSKRFLNLKGIIYNKIFLLFNANFWKINHANYVYLVGRYAYLNRFDNKIIGKKTKLIKGYHRNYVVYLNQKNKKIKLKNKTALFIDQQVPYHPELTEMGLSDIDAKKYYDSIKVFLEKLEKVFAYKIEISCHPKFNMKNLQKNFPKYKIKIGKTIDQIRSSNLVITHYSTAVDFAVLYNKPIIFITNNELNQGTYPHREEIEAKANCFKKKTVNIDSFPVNKIINEFKVNKSIYKTYSSDFIKFSNVHKPQPNIVIDKLKKDKVWI